MSSLFAEWVFRTNLLEEWGGITTLTWFSFQLSSCWKILLFKVFSWPGPALLGLKGHSHVCTIGGGAMHLLPVKLTEQGCLPARLVFGLLWSLVLGVKYGDLLHCLSGPPCVVGAAHSCPVLPFYRVWSQRHPRALTERREPPFFSPTMLDCFFLPD